MSKLNFYRAMPSSEYKFHENHRFIWTHKEWVESNLELDRGGFRFKWIKDMVDRIGFWGEKSDHDVIIKVQARVDEFEFIVDEIIPLRYKNYQDIPFDRAQLVYDPRAVVSDAPLLFRVE